MAAAGVLNETASSSADLRENRCGRKARQAPHLSREMRLVGISRLECEVRKTRLFGPSR